MTEKPAPGPFIAVALVALLPLLAMSAAAPGGDHWRWLEYPRPTTVLALGAAIVCCAHGPRTTSWLWVAAATFAGALIYEKVEFPGWDLAHTFGEAVQRLSTFAIIGAYGALVTLAAVITKPNVWRASGLWLVMLGGFCVIITLANESWNTLENFTKPGHFRSSAAWPDTKKISIVLAALTVMTGAVMAVRRAASPIPRATLRR